MGGKKIVRMPSRAAGVIWRPSTDRRYSRSSPSERGARPTGSSTSSATRTISDT